MSAFIINLKDTIAVSDSALVELAKVASQPCAQEAETNCCDVYIVAIVCIAIVLVALIAKRTICSWKDAEIQAARDRLKYIETEADAAKRKKDAAVLDKLIDYLGRNTTCEEYNKETKEKIKKERGIKSEEGQYYINVLRALLNDAYEIPEYPSPKSK